LRQYLKNIKGGESSGKLKKTFKLGKSLGEGFTQRGVFLGGRGGEPWGKNMGKQEL